VPWLNNNSKAEVHDLFSSIVELLEKEVSEGFINHWALLLQWVTSLPGVLSQHSFQSLNDDLDLEILHQMPRLLLAILKRRSPFPSVVQDADLIRFTRVFAQLATCTMDLDV